MVRSRVLSIGCSTDHTYQPVPRGVRRDERLSRTQLMVERSAMLSHALYTHRTHELDGVRMLCLEVRVKMEHRRPRVTPRGALLLGAHGGDVLEELTHVLVVGQERGAREEHFDTRFAKVTSIILLAVARAMGCSDPLLGIT